MDLRIDRGEWKRKLVASLTAGAILLLTALWVRPVAAQTASGTIDFDSDPGFTIVDDPPFVDGEFGPNTPIDVDLRLDDAQCSVMELTLTRDQGIERLSLPINESFFGNENNFKEKGIRG